MHKLIIGGTILTPAHSTTDSAILIENERIVSIEPMTNRSMGEWKNADIIDASGFYVIPGLIDIHVHGGYGSDTMDATPAALNKMSKGFLKNGVTSFLGTTASQSEEAILHAIKVAAENQVNLDGANLLGLHIEGPYLDSCFRGAHHSKWLRDPNPEEYHKWFESGVVRLITIAPELNGAQQLIRQGCQHNIRFAAGHTQASPLQIQEAVDLGLTSSTHTFNGMAGLHHRDLGTVGALLADNRVYCEVIADGVHVHPDIVKMIVRIKGIERTILVTDAIRASGQPDGLYDLAGQIIHVKDGIARTETGGLAGSTLKLNKAVTNIIKFAGLSFNDALSMATKTPADFLGLSGKKGEIIPGADADIVLVDREMQVRLVMIGGQVKYDLHLM